MNPKRKKKGIIENNQTPPVKINLFTPFSLYLVLPGFVLWLIFGTVTQPLQDGGLLGDVVGSFRLLFLTMTLFFMATGILGYIFFPEARIRFHNSVKRMILRKKDLS